MVLRDGDGSAPALGVSATGIPRLSANRSRWPPFRSSLGRTDLFRDHSSYRNGPQEPYHLTKKSQLGFSYHACHLAHPSLTENSIIIGDQVVPAIAHDSAKIPSTKRIQTAALVGPDAPGFGAI